MEDTTSKKIYLEWSDIHELVNIICDKVKKDFKQIETVHGLKRGGFIPAVIISHQLGLEYVDEPEIDYHTLIVDDICDSGHTLDNAPGWFHAVLHHKLETASFKPAIYAKPIKEEWIVYPWEREDSEAIQDYKKK
mgnify:CR=1 FL=1|tara:strand:+ start:2519 stop:2923 length:405 start_codon:yes stop_codon:yes gene_type:complete